MDTVEVQHIERTPGVCGGRARIAGHRIRVMDIVGWHEKRGYTVAQLVEMFPGISRADVHAALAYYYDNMEEVDRDFENDDEWARWAEAHLPSLIRQQMKDTLGG